MSAPSLQPMSVAEYLRTEESSPVKREYVGGYVYALHGATKAQAGTSGQHVEIGVNIVAALHRAARAQGCRLYSSDMKLRLPYASNFYYPDVMLVCSAERPDSHYETAPCLLVEIISPSTASTDRLAKHAAYTAIPSLQTYLIVEQQERRVYVYQRGGSEWELSEQVGSGDILLPCVGQSLSLDDIYSGVLDS
ncbi:Uma2 family endonuclease [Deinococcus sp. Arct2-2]|uniref:Uma2 family endonuclease n=1 Tax=Deinococcus sp. Arct2-2 TaxID=2568653 RepID=UPI0010A3CF3C|nr:Uma2 family endonuclease [Deinococcus sp. Arct2-2]THF70055.1 Uma2 family endonuclease [Deinococcus sp. Arct2-2]